MKNFLGNWKWSLKKIAKTALLASIGLTSVAQQKVMNTKVAPDKIAKSNVHNTLTEKEKTSEGPKSYIYYQIWWKDWDYDEAVKCIESMWFDNIKIEKIKANNFRPEEISWKVTWGMEEVKTFFRWNYEGAQSASNEAFLLIKKASEEIKKTWKKWLIVFTIPSNLSIPFTAAKVKNFIWWCDIIIQREENYNNTMQSLGIILDDVMKVNTAMIFEAANGAKYDVYNMGTELRDINKNYENLVFMLPYAYIANNIQANNGAYYVKLYGNADEFFGKYKRTSNKRAISTQQSEVEDIKKMMNPSNGEYIWTIIVKWFEVLWAKESINNTTPKAEVKIDQSQNKANGFRTADLDRLEEKLKTVSMHILWKINKKEMQKWLLDVVFDGYINPRSIKTWEDFVTRKNINENFNFGVDKFDPKEFFEWQKNWELGEKYEYIKNITKDMPQYSTIYIWIGKTKLVKEDWSPYISYIWSIGDVNVALIPEWTEKTIANHAGRFELLVNMYILIKWWNREESLVVSFGTTNNYFASQVKDVRWTKRSNLPFWIKTLKEAKDKDTWIYISREDIMKFKEAIINGQPIDKYVKIWAWAYQLYMDIDI